MRLYGVDGCRDGWVLASAVAAGGPVEFTIVGGLEAVVEQAAAGRALVVIDMPIGLAGAEPRECDLEARKRLGRPRASSVFPPPSRPALAASGYLEACALNAQATGRRLQKQCFYLLPKIRQLDELLTPDLQARVREGHPEVIFTVLAGGERGLRHYKKTPAGEAERLVLLARWLPELDGRALTAERARLGAGRVGRDDLLDAAACLVTARRVLRGEAVCLPSNHPPRDARGLRMEILA